MKIQTDDREQVCLLVAINGLKPETSHSGRRRKTRAFEQLGLVRIEELGLPGGERATMVITLWPPNASEVEIEDGTADYLLEKFGGDSEVSGGSFVERAVCAFISKIQAQQIM
jgi:hypothetical protein